MPVYSDAFSIGKSWRRVSHTSTQRQKSLLWISRLINVKYSTLLSVSFHIAAYSCMLASMLFIYFRNKVLLLLGIFLIINISTVSGVVCQWNVIIQKKKKWRLYSFSLFLDINEKLVSGVFYVNIFHLYKYCVFHITNQC